MKIKSMLIISLILFTLVGTITYDVVVGGQMSNTAITQYEYLIKDMAEVSSGNVCNYVTSLADTTKKLAYNTAIEDFTKSSSSKRLKSGDVEYDAALEALNSYIGDDTNISRIIIVSDSNEICLNTSDEYEFLLTTDEIAAFSTDFAYISPIYANEKVIDYELVTKYVSNGMPVLVFYNNAKLKTLIGSSSFPTNGRIVIVDPDGALIDVTYINNLSESNLTEYATIKDAIYTNASSLAKLCRFEVAKNPRISYTIKDETTGWYVSTLAEENMAYSYSSSNASSMIGTTIALIIILSVAAFVVVIKITKPLAKIEEALVKVHRGDHDTRIQVMTKNEYGDIARSFNGLIDEIIVSERRYRTIVEMSDDIVFEWNFKSNEIFFSNNFNKKFSYRAPSDHYTDSFLLKGKVHPDDVERYRSDLELLSKGEEFTGNEYRWKNIYGDYIWVQMKTATIRSKEGEIVKIVGIIKDIDRAKNSENQLMARASYDSLTGVYNRETIENVIEQEITKINGNDGRDFAILFVDIDDFKIFNDRYSHATGDQVLKFTSDTIMSIVKDFGFVGRYGGDEFIVCTRNTTINDPGRIAQEILTKLKEGFVCDSDTKLSVNVSIGLTKINTEDKHVDEIISMADEAMYRIKKNGKSNFGYF